MALRAVIDHPKFAALKGALGMTKFQALGVLETLWHFTGKFCPQGNVGRFTDEQIESWIEWNGDAEALVKALVHSGWIDLSAEHRLLVHDWHEHADQTTRKQLGRKRLSFLTLSQTCPGHVTDMSSRNGKVSGPPAPAPGPAPEPVPEPEENPSPSPSAPAGVSAASKSSKREVNPRHDECRKHIQAYWVHRHQNAQLPWNGSDAAALSDLLRSNPGLMPDEFRRLLGNRNSSEVNHSDRPRKWLGALMSYSSGPIDRFGKPKGTSHANTRGQQRTNGNLDAAHRFAARRGRGVAGDGDAHRDGGAAPGLLQ